MNEQLLPTVVRVQTAAGTWRARAARAWADRNDETGIDEAVTKMIWLAVGIGVAILATTFFMGVFEDAKSQVPSPVAP